MQDLEWIASFQKGCELSFEKLIRKYETKVHNLSMRLTRNQEDAEEILQDVFVTVYRKIEGFEGKAKFSSWLYRITVNASLMKLRKRKQDQSIPLEDVFAVASQHDLHSSMASNSELSDSRLQNWEIRTELEDAISKLPHEYKAVFILRDIDGLSNKEVGEILDLSIPAVKSRLHRSRLMLRKKLGRYFEDYQSKTKIYASNAHLAR